MKQNTPKTQAPRAAFRLYAVRITRIQRLTPGMVRITFQGSDLQLVGNVGLDQRIKVFLPRSSQKPEELLAEIQSEDYQNSSWYQNWRQLNPETRPPFRTYTAKNSRPDHKELDVDFVDHGPSGAAGTWLHRVQAGEWTLVAAPNVEVADPPPGIEWAPPPEAQQLVLIGDETALPAIDSILRSLLKHPDNRPAAVTAFIEVPQEKDVDPIPGYRNLVAGSENNSKQKDQAPENLGAVIWLPRSGISRADGLKGGPRRHFYGQRMRVAAQEFFAGGQAASEHRGVYVWVAGESSSVVAVRRYLIREVGLKRSQVTFMGYWRYGQAEN